MMRDKIVYFVDNRRYFFIRIFRIKVIIDVDNLWIYLYFYDLLIIDYWFLYVDCLSCMG